MATLISKATGNWTAAGTWNLADSTTELDAENASETSTTVYKASANFSPGAITVDAIALKFQSRSASPTGTFSVELFNSTGSLSVATVTTDVSDLPQGGGWVVFPIGSTLLLAATNYQIRIKTSTISMVTIYRNATAANWSRQLRTTTTQAPAAGDKLIVTGEHTGVGTGNSFTITMNETATTAYGNTTFLQSVTVSKRSTLSFGVAASTNYYLKVRGFLKLFDQSTFNIGTTGTPIPSTSTAVLEFDCTAAVDSGLITLDGSTFNAQGAALTYDRAFLAADVAVAATSATSDVSTGWLNNDEIGFAPTERTIAQFEKATLNANASGTSLSLTAGLTYAHDGSTFAKGELVNLTRNVKIRSVSATLVAYISISATASIDCDWIEFTKLGNAGSTTSAIAVNTTTGVVSFERCSFHDNTIASGAIFRILANPIAPGSLTISNNVFYNNVYIAIYYSIVTNTPGVMTFNSNWIIGGTTGFHLVNPSAVMTGNRLSGLTTGINYAGSSAAPLGANTDTVCHACATGLFVVSCNDGIVTNYSAWRCTAFGLEVTTSIRIVFNTASLKSGTTGNIRLTNAIDCVFNTFTLMSESSYATGYGMYIGGYNDKSIMYNSIFGGTASEDHTTGDLVSTAVLTSMIFHKCTFSSSTEYPLSINRPGASYQSQDHQNTAGNNKTVKFEGTLSRDTTIFNAASSSLRLAPALTSVKLFSNVWRTVVSSGSTVAASVTVRKSVVGDGTAYNGAQPRLFVKANPAAGILVDTVLATASGAAGSWETLSGTTAAVSENTALEFYLDCDGTTGWVNADDATLVSAFATDFNTWSNGEVVVRGTSDVSSLYSDPGQTNVRLGVAYKFNSPTNNKTGTVRLPSVGQVKTGVVYDDADSLTGTYDGSDRWSDPGQTNVKLGTVYKANSLTNNRTGTVRIPAVSDVRLAVAYGDADSLVGTVRLPAVSNVRLGIAFDASDSLVGTVRLPSVANVRLGSVFDASDSLVGTVRVPTISQVKVGIAYDAADSLVGTYTASELWSDPGDSNVRSPVAYLAAGVPKTGRVVVPVAASVKISTAFETDAATIGTYTGSDRWTDPDQDNVTLGVTYKANSLVINRTGTVRLPVVSDVNDGVLYGPNDSLVGTFGDGTPPTFAGLVSAVANSVGSVSLAWLSAVDSSSPINYEVYVQANTATGLFSLTNVAFATRNLSADVYQLANLTLLVAGTTYYFGVRAVDAFDNRELNTVSFSAVSTGVNTDSLAALLQAKFTFVDRITCTITDESLEAKITDDKIVAEIKDELP